MDKYLRHATIRIALLLILLLFVANALAAQMVYKDASGNVVWLTEEPCDVPGALAVLADDLKPLFKRGRLYYKGKDYKTCWALNPQGVVWVIDEGGEVIRIPVQLFRQDHGA